MSTTFGTPQTMTRAYQQICGGEEPWIALGNFRNAWYGYAKDRRVALVSEPLAKPVQDTELTHRWSAFCAATVEFLCERYDVACPPWVYDPRYTLETPWWYTERADDPEIGRGSCKRHQGLSHGATFFVATGSIRTSMK